VTIGEGLRAILAASELRELQVPLNFFRMGRLDVHAERFIEAFHDFFFVIETLFADGKSRTQAMKNAFAVSPVLLESTRETMRGEAISIHVRRNPHVIARLNDLYVRPTPIETLASIINTRGVLHHHSRKHRGTWHPERHEVFETDTIIIQEIAYKVLWKLTREAIFSAPAVERYQKLFAGVVKQANGPDKQNPSHVRWCIPNIETPFPVEFARTSSSRDGAPTLVPVERDGSPVRAVIFALDSEVMASEGADLLWRRETRETGDRHYKPKPNAGPNPDPTIFRGAKPRMN